MHVYTFSFQSSSPHVVFLCTQLSFDIGLKLFCSNGGLKSVLKVSYDHKVFLKRDGLLPKGWLGTKYM